MIVFDRVSLRAGKKEILADISFSVAKGELFTIIGPSGAGKTSILRLVDLLAGPSSGTVLIDGSSTTTLSEREKVALRRRMGLVFQKPVALRGDVFSNVAAGLYFRKHPEQDVRARVDEVLGQVGLAGFAARDAASLSGGEMQRVALARALATRPEILLLDEPTANLDPVATGIIEDLIEQIRQESAITIVLCTHDMVQGQRLADRMAVVLDGKIRQTGTSREIFTQPVNRAVARMVGVENILEGIVRENDAGLALIQVGNIHLHAASPLPAGTPVTLYMRPEDITCSASGADHGSARNVLTGPITRVLPVGPMVRITMDAGIRLTAVITLKSYDELGLAVGKEVAFSFKASAMHVGPYLS
jgi:tungstate transport system ATP-binding protein